VFVFQSQVYLSSTTSKNNILLSPCTSRLYIPRRRLTVSNLGTFGNEEYAELGSRFKGSHVKRMVWWLAKKTQKISDQRRGHDSWFSFGNRWNPNTIQSQQLCVFFGGAGFWPEGWLRNINSYGVTSFKDFWTGSERFSLAPLETKKQHYRGVAYLSLIFDTWGLKWEYPQLIHFNRILHYKS
jgi:hypothetical protein